MRPSEKAWVALAAGVVFYDTFCPKGETLSEGVDRALAHPRGRMITMGAVTTVAAHLLNALPERLDPIHLMFITVRSELEMVVRPRQTPDKKKNAQIALIRRRKALIAKLNAFQRK